MGVRLYQQPSLKKPDMIACWPGIGNIGLIAVDTLRGQIQARELGEIEPWDFFYPRKVIIKASVLEDLEFPSNKFYYKRLGKKDLIFFIGEEQPTDGEGMYAEGRKAYQMANLVLDVAERFGCRRVYTSGAAVALTHHTLKPKVWAVTSRDDLNREVKSYENTILMGEVEGVGGQGSITGLNGLLLGLAKKRGFEAVCLMGEIPDYLSRAPLPYPRASKAVLEVLTKVMKIEIDYGALDEMAVQVDDVINSLYEKFPPEIRERIEQRKSIAQAKPETITDEDEKWIKEHIDELFKKGGKGDEKSS
ncbi:MAG: PAC2 family protein [Dehalococcoidales bacterium]